VRLDGRGFDHELVCDLGVGQAASEQANDVLLGRACLTPVRDCVPLGAGQWIYPRFAASQRRRGSCSPHRSLLPRPGFLDTGPP